MQFFGQRNIRRFLFLLTAMLSSAVFAGDGKSLSLQDILIRVENCYPQVRIAALEINKARGDYLRVQGQFDPAFDINSQSQPVGGYINHSTDGVFNIPTKYNGVSLFGGYRIGRGDWPIYYQNYLTNSGGEYRAGLSLPLLRNRKIDQQRTDLLTNRENIQLKKYEADAVKIQVYQETINAYWQWVEAGMQVRTLHHMLMLAKKRQHAIAQRAKQGDLAQLAVAENMQYIVQREQLLNQGKMALEQAAINLSLYYRDNKGKPDVPQEQQLPMRFSSNIPQKIRLQSMLREHPVLRKLDNYSKIVKLKQNLAENALLPYLDGRAYTFKQSGTGGYPLLLSQGLMIGVNLKLPLFQREARGRLISLSNELAQVKTQWKFTYDQLKNSLANILLAMKIYQKQTALLRKELSLARQVEMAENKKFDAGDSTLFLVNQREQMSAQVKLNWINAVANWHKSQDLARYFISTSPRPDTGATAQG